MNQKPPGKKAKLTDKQRRFCQEYILDMNATQAAKRAGYAPRSALWVGSRMLRSGIVADHIKELRDKQLKRLEITADRVLTELARIAFVDPSKIMRVTRRTPYSRTCVEITPSDDLDEDHRAVISELSENEKGGIRCKLASKEKALELLGRHLGLFIDRTEMSGPGGGPIRTTDGAAKLTDADLERIAANDPE
jgi:phage terminase small subunit